MHPTKYLLLVGWLLSTAWAASGQQMQVIAANGLRLRATPDTKAAVKEVVPFGETVMLLDTTRYNHDTIRWVKDYGYYYILHRFGGHTEGNGDFPLTGHWRKVQWNKSTGYVFDAWLSPVRDVIPEFRCPHVRDAANPVNQLVRFEGRIFRLDFDPRCYHWYGLYDDGEQAQIKAIEVDFVIGFSETGDEGVRYLANNHKQLKYIIGSVQRLPERKFPYEKFDPWTVGWQTSQPSEPIKGSTVKTDWLFYSKDKNSPDMEQSRSIYLKPKTGKDLLFKLDDFMGSEFFLSMVADIDGDGIDDYVICFSTDLIGQALYLSSNYNYPEGWWPSAYFSYSMC